MWQAKYETIYLLGTSIARPLISKICLDVAKEVGAKAYATARRARETTSVVFSWRRKRFDPTIQVIAPWRNKKFRDQFPGRTELIAYCDAKGIPVKATSKKPYSSDENVFLHISYEAVRWKTSTCAVSNWSTLE